ncbi:metallopeptidase family protein [Conexibacter stalactiti]|uniref:Metallopeptidase family protein n=1 Tax=Conexibacter stalactiti TaxID=1940611 RepID=A0ABU4HT36_9ACTN|nr:metallopeptidase family protein [Conexibacter stalactiti]MDW5596481.1 metallopeptidase family protein [Conexibacter stalactiti]MEC5037123.1 metallopeptidase family protein [Conexibacter stalactiti]
MRAPTPKRILFAAFVALLIGIAVITLYQGFATDYPMRLFQGIAVAAAGVVVVAFLMSLITGPLAGWRDPESDEEFDELVDRSERLAREGSWGEVDDDLYGDDDDDDEDDLFDPWNEEDFQTIVRRAVDELPLEFHRALEHVAIVVSDGGRRRGAYGLYHGDTVARDGFADRIIIYRDTLLRDFGHNPDLLRAQVTRTLRHELAHHLGWDEDGVRGLGL